MTPTRQGSFHLFRFAGVDLYLHWSWFAVAAYEITNRGTSYSSLTWNALEYLTLFLIVMLHEFGHALACRQVGGRANQIVLWPLGGVAYVDPPPRPGATLWSIAAGPPDNVALGAVLSMLVWLRRLFCRGPRRSGVTTDSPVRTAKAPRPRVPFGCAANVGNHSIYLKRKRFVRIAARSSPRRAAWIAAACMQ